MPYREQGRAPDQVCPKCGWSPVGQPFTLTLDAGALARRVVKVAITYGCPCGATKFTDVREDFTYTGDVKAAIEAREQKPEPPWATAWRKKVLQHEEPAFSHSPEVLAPAVDDDLDDSDWPYGPPRKRGEPE